MPRTAGASVETSHGTNVIDFPESVQVRKKIIDQTAKDVAREVLVFLFENRDDFRVEGKDKKESAALLATEAASIKKQFLAQLARDGFYEALPKDVSQSAVRAALQDSFVKFMDAYADVVAAEPNMEDAVSVLARAYKEKKTSQIKKMMPKTSIEDSAKNLTDDISMENAVGNGHDIVLPGDESYQEDVPHGVDTSNVITPLQKRKRNVANAAKLSQEINRSVGATDNPQKTAATANTSKPMPHGSRSTPETQPTGPAAPEVSTSERTTGGGGPGVPEEGDTEFSRIKGVLTSLDADAKLVKSFTIDGNVYVRAGEGFHLMDAAAGEEAAARAVAPEMLARFADGKKAYVAAVAAHEAAVAHAEAFAQKVRDLMAEGENSGVTFPHLTAEDFADTKYESRHVVEAAAAMAAAKEALAAARTEVKAAQGIKEAAPAAVAAEPADTKIATPDAANKSQEQAAPKISQEQANANLAVAREAYVAAYLAGGDVAGAEAAYQAALHKYLEQYRNDPVRYMRAALDKTEFLASYMESAGANVGKDMSGVAAALRKSAREHLGKGKQQRIEGDVLAESFAGIDTLGTGRTLPVAEQFIDPAVAEEIRTLQEAGKWEEAALRAADALNSDADRALDGLTLDEAQKRAAWSMGRRFLEALQRMGGAARRDEIIAARDTYATHEKALAEQLRQQRLAKNAVAIARASGIPDAPVATPAHAPKGRVARATYRAGRAVAAAGRIVRGPVPAPEFSDDELRAAARGDVTENPAAESVPATTSVGASKKMAGVITATIGEGGDKNTIDAALGGKLRWGFSNLRANINYPLVEKKRYAATVDSVLQRTGLGAVADVAVKNIAMLTTHQQEMLAGYDANAVKLFGPGYGITRNAKATIREYVTLIERFKAGSSWKTLDIVPVGEVAVEGITIENDRVGHHDVLAGDRELTPDEIAKAGGDFRPGSDRGAKVELSEEDGGPAADTLLEQRAEELSASFEVVGATLHITNERQWDTLMRDINNLPENVLGGIQVYVDGAAKQFPNKELTLDTIAVRNMRLREYVQKVEELRLDAEAARA